MDPIEDKCIGKGAFIFSLLLNPCSHHWTYIGNQEISSFYHQITLQIVPQNLSLVD